MQLSAHFELSEFTRTRATAPNVPTPEHIEAMGLLCTEVLEDWRASVGRLYITSGFRSKLVNIELRSYGYETADNSEHCEGRAADCRPLDTPLDVAWHRLMRLAHLLPIGQAILYVRPKGSGWVHVSHDPTEPRRRDLRVKPPTGRTIPWSGYSGPLVLPG